MVLGPVFNGAVERVADLHAARLLGDALDEALVDAFLDEQPAGRDAVLAFVEEDGVAGLRGRPAACTRTC